jgi:hypothetical protein
MKYNRYTTPKPHGRPYTDPEQKLAKEIDELREEKARAKRSMHDAQLHYNQSMKKYSRMPNYPKREFFVRGNTHPDPEAYKELVRKDKLYDARVKPIQDELRALHNTIDNRDTDMMRAHLGMCSRIDILGNMIKKNDKILKEKRSR